MTTEKHPYGWGTNRAEEPEPVNISCGNPHHRAEEPEPVNIQLDPESLRDMYVSDELEELRASLLHLLINHCDADRPEPEAPRDICFENPGAPALAGIWRAVEESLRPQEKRDEEQCCDYVPSWAEPESNE